LNHIIVVVSKSFLVQFYPRVFKEQSNRIKKDSKTRKRNVQAYHNVKYLNRYIILGQWFYKLVSLSSATIINNNKKKKFTYTQNDIDLSMF
jgi:hypothetical protein